jgi:hypothetical protein
MRIDKTISMLNEKKKTAKSDAERYNIQMKIDILLKKQRNENN